MHMVRIDPLLTFQLIDCKLTINQLAEVA